MLWQWEVPHSLLLPFRFMAISQLVYPKWSKFIFDLKISQSSRPFKIPQASFSYLSLCMYHTFQCNFLNFSLGPLSNKQCLFLQIPRVLCLSTLSASAFDYHSFHFWIHETGTFLLLSQVALQAWPGPTGESWCPGPRILMGPCSSRRDPRSRLQTRGKASLRESAAF